MLYIKFFILSLLSLFAWNAVAQDAPADEGEIEQGQVIINKDLDIELPQAERKYEKIPPLPEEDKATENLSYRFLETGAQFPGLNPRLRVLKIKSGSSEAQFGNYIKAGYGNYASPYLHAYLHNKDHRNASYGLRFFHHSAGKGPVDGKNSANGNTRLDFNGKLAGDNINAKGRLGYGLDKYHFYGYPDDVEVSKDTIGQLFNTFNAGLTIENHDPEAPLRLKGSVDFYYWQDDFEVSERQFSVGFNGEQDITDHLYGGLDARLHFINYETTTTLNRNIVQIRPYVIYNEDLWRVDAGIKIAGQNDTITSSENFIIFPDVRATYELGYDLLAYGELTGGIEPVTMRGLTSDNPYLGANIPVYNTTTSIHLEGGVRGNLSNKISFESGMGLSVNRNMHFFLNDSTRQSRFDVIYNPGNTTVFNLSGGLSYSNEKIYGASLDMDYYGYSTEEIDEAWHRPRFMTTIDAWYNLYDKIIISTTFNTWSGIRAVDADTGATITLEPAIDWNVQLDYKFSDEYGAFIMLNNILSENYELYHHYPVRALQVKLGATISF